MTDSLDISILESGDNARAVALARFGPDLAVEMLPCALLTGLASFREMLNKAAGKRGQPPNGPELIKFGRDLFNFVIRDTLQTLYNGLPVSRIRIQILSNRSDLQALPWEYLLEPNVKVSQPNNVRGIVRIVPTVGVHRPDPPKLSGAIRLLFVYADPVDLGRVDWASVKSVIEVAFRSRLTENFKIDVVEGASRDSLKAALAAKNYDILHFSGHGQVRADGRGQILLKNFKSKKTEPMLAEELAAVIRGRGIQLIVFSSCSTSAGDFVQGYAVVAKTLVEAGVAAVVANQFAVDNSQVATFATGLYRELLRSGDIDQAVAEGRMLLYSPPVSGDRASFEWGIPTLYRHIGSAQIFTP